MTKAILKILHLVLAVWLGLSSCPTIAKDEDSSRRAHVSVAINNAFSSFKHQMGVAFDPELEKELKRAYLEEILNLDPAEYANPSAASHLVNKYSQEDGVKEILSNWTSATEQSQWEDIFSIDAILSMNVYFGSKDPNIHPMFSENMANKYATLIVEPEPETLKASIYLDEAFVCVISECPKGMRLASDRTYSLFVRADGFSELRQKITLSRQERKVVKYAPSALR